MDQMGIISELEAMMPLCGRSLRAGALFSGIGGFCMGFHRAGVPTGWAIEMDPFAVATYKANFPTVDTLQRDVRDVSLNNTNLEPVDILHAGFPCQSFSQAGSRQGFHDPRGRLFYEIIRIIREFGETKPKALILENTPYLRYGERGAWFLELQREIQKAGYWFREANCAELNTYDITALPQQRVRLFMVAFCMKHFRSGKFSFPNDKITDPKRLEDYIDFDGSQYDEYYLHWENRYYRMISRRVNDEKRVYQLRKYEVRAKDPGVCPTLTANMGLGGHNVPFVVDRRGLRKLTEQECLKLQGFGQFVFPDEVPRARRYTQVGNAVTVPVAELVAQRVVEKFRQELFQ
jgi:DNA (cytosine-5)-methyltransferase 1